MNRFTIHATLICTLVLVAVVSGSAWASNRVVVSSPSVGSGAAVVGPSDLILDSLGVVAIDNATDFVFRIDPVTGDRTIIPSPSVGSGMVFDILSGLAVEASGDFVVTDAGFTHDPLVGRIDSINGNRTIVSSPSVGSGPAPVSRTLSSRLSLRGVARDAPCRCSGNRLCYPNTSPSCPLSCLSRC